MSIGEKQQDDQEAESKRVPRARKSRFDAEREQLVELIEELEDEAIQHLLGIARLLQDDDSSSP